MRSLLNRPFDLDRLAAELARENFQVLGLREDVHLLAVGTLNGQFALRVERRCFPVFGHFLDCLTAIKFAGTLAVVAGRDWREELKAPLVDDTVATLRWKHGSNSSKSA